MMLKLQHHDVASREFAPGEGAASRKGGIDTPPIQEAGGLTPRPTFKKEEDAHPTPPLQEEGGAHTIPPSQWKED